MSLLLLPLRPLFLFRRSEARRRGHQPPARSPTADPRTVANDRPAPRESCYCCRYCPCGADGRTPCRGQLAPAHLPAPARPRDGRSRLYPPSSRGRALRAHPVMVRIYTRRQRLRRSSTAARVKRLRTAWTRVRTQCPLGMLLQLPRPLCPMVANGRPARPTSSAAHPGRCPGSATAPDC